MAIDVINLGNGKSTMTAEFTNWECWISTLRLVYQRANDSSVKKVKQGVMFVDRI
jgi:hypothetical protein